VTSKGLLRFAVVFHGATLVGYLWVACQMHMDLLALPAGLAVWFGARATHALRKGET